MIRAYIIGAAAIALAAGVWYIRHDAAMSERARIEAERAGTTITQTEAFNEAADDPDAIGSWFDRLFPSSAAE